MKRFKPIIFLLCLLMLCWLGMQAIHELGHCLAALLSGGTITKLVLDPLSISRTDVSPNPHPMLVVWAGPLFGSLAPLAIWKLIPQIATLLRTCCGFFAGFCCVANGAYLLFGIIDHVGDCGTMVSLGCGKAVIGTYGFTTLLIGLTIWHQLGSPTQLLKNSDWCSAASVSVVLGCLLILTLIGKVCFPA